MGNSSLILAVGAPNAAPQSVGRTRPGTVFLFALTSQGIVTAVDLIPTASSPLRAAITHNDRFGSSVAEIGDLDGDGLAELAIGAKGDDTRGVQAGAVYVIFLSPAGANGTFPRVTRHVKLSSPAGAYGAFGSTIASAGDLNGDGHPDLVVGAPGATRVGAVYLLTLRANGTMSEYARLAPSPTGIDTLFGTAVAVSSTLAPANVAAAASRGVSFGRGLQRLPGERILAIGAPGGAHDGRVYLYRLPAPPAQGRLGTPPAALEHVLEGADWLQAPMGNAGYGSALSYSYDYDGNGEVELIVGAPGAPGGGALSIHFLGHGGTRTLRTVYVTALSINRPSASYFGRAVTSIGALNARDHVGDLAVGSLDDSYATGSGAISILFMLPSTTNPAPNPPPRLASPPSLIVRSPHSPMPAVPLASPPPTAAEPLVVPLPPLGWGAFPPVQTDPHSPPALPRTLYPPAAPVDGPGKDQALSSNSKRGNINAGAIIGLTLGGLVLILCAVAYARRSGKMGWSNVCMHMRSTSKQGGTLTSIEEESCTPRDASSPKGLRPIAAAPAFLPPAVGPVQPPPASPDGQGDDSVETVSPLPILPSAVAPAMVPTSAHGCSARHINSPQHIDGVSTLKDSTASHLAAAPTFAEPPSPLSAAGTAALERVRSHKSLSVPQVAAMEGASPSTRLDAAGNEAPCGSLGTMGGIRRAQSFGMNGVSTATASNEPLSPLSSVRAVAMLSVQARSRFSATREEESPTTRLDAAGNEALCGTLGTMGSIPRRTSSFGIHGGDQRHRSRLVACDATPATDNETQTERT